MLRAMASHAKVKLAMGKHARDRRALTANANPVRRPSAKENGLREDLRRAVMAIRLPLDRAAKVVRAMAKVVRRCRVKEDRVTVKVVRHLVRKAGAKVVRAKEWDGHNLARATNPTSSISASMIRKCTI